ncbi:Cof-type HAD-IIB family hydrolase [Paenibacillus kandeliae]|uniref:Cof-type HAD-IIB family hydrolase n=1 Tax=Paenibacillus kandeliae TaxID=3231269 RepID=UPI00345A9397
MSNQSIIFFDIDGTLLDFNKELPASTKQAIFELRERGHEVAIATGRAPFMFEKIREELQIDTYVSYNGQYVVLRGEVLYTNPLNPDALVKLSQAAIENENPIVYMDADDMRANVPDEHEYITTSISTLHVDKFPTYDPAYYEQREMYQCLLFCLEGAEQNYAADFKDFDFIRWHPMSVDVLPAGGSKANGISKITEKLGFPKERQYAFGDGLNDVEMLKQIYNSVAMGNAEPEAKAVARHVTKPVDQDGILHGLQMVGLLD